MVVVAKHVFVLTIFTRCTIDLDIVYTIRKLLVFQLIPVKSNKIETPRLFLVVVALNSAQFDVSKAIHPQKNAGHCTWLSGPRHTHVVPCTTKQGLLVTNYGSAALRARERTASRRHCARALPHIDRWRGDWETPRSTEELWATIRKVTPSQYTQCLMCKVLP